MKKKMLFCSLPLLLGIVSSEVGYAYNANLLNLIQSYELALESDPVFKSANDQRLANEQAIPTAVSGFLPFVTAQATQQNVMTDNFFNYEPTPIDNQLGITIVGTQVIRTSTYSGNLQQTLFDMSKWHTLKQAYRIKDAAQAYYIDASQDLIFRTASAYFRILDAIDNLNFVTAEKEAIEQQLYQTTEKFNVGLLAITDVKELEAQRDAILAQQISAYNRIESARESFRVITGVFPEKLAALKEDIPLMAPTPDDGDTWAGIAEETNPKLQGAHFSTEVQKQNVNIAKDKNLPTVGFSGTTFKARYGTWADPTSATSEWQWTALLTAQMNVFSGGAITSNIRRAQYTYQQSLDDLEKVRRDVIKAAEDAYRDVQTALTSVKAYRKSVISNQVAVDATIAGYHAGTRTSVDVLTEISKLYQQQKNLATARYTYVLSILSLKKAAGILTIQDMMAINQMLLEKPAIINKEEEEKKEIQNFIAGKNSTKKVKLQPMHYP